MLAIIKDTIRLFIDIQDVADGLDIEKSCGGEIFRYLA